MGIELQLQAVDAETVNELLANRGRALATLSRLRTPRCNVHKAWHAIHYLLTGAAEGGEAPNGYLLEGGEELGGDTGYGPPRLLRPEQVRAFNEVLQPINRLSVLRERFNHAGMVAAGVYSMNDDGEDEDLEFTAEFFKQLRRFIKQTADAGQGVVITFE